MFYRPQMFSDPELTLKFLQIEALNYLVILTMKFENMPNITKYGMSVNFENKNEFTTTIWVLTDHVDETGTWQHW